MTWRFDYHTRDIDTGENLKRRKETLYRNSRKRAKLIHFFDFDIDFIETIWEFFGPKWC